MLEYSLCSSNMNNLVKKKRGGLTFVGSVGIINFRLSISK